MTIEFGRPMIGEAEEQAVLAALRNKTLTNGPMVAEFETAFEQFTGGQSAAVSSCMAALHIACMAYVKPGDEVIVPALTHPATAHAVELVGGRCAFVDVSPVTGNITAEAIEAAITRKTVAVMVVHYLGRMADMGAIMTLAKAKNLAVIEDCALALGAHANGVHAGLHGEAGCFSFYPVKHITTCEGGMLISKDPSTVQFAKEKRAFGLGRSLGLNYRMSELHAALGVAQLRNVDIYRQRRQSNYRRMADRLKDYRIIESDGPGASYYALTVFIPPHLKRNEVRRAMKAKGVETSVYYAPIVPDHPYYLEEYGLSNFRNASEIADHSLCLSCGPHLTADDVAYQVMRLKECVPCG